MPYSALALGQQELRLRSRRVRSDRSRRETGGTWFWLRVVLATLVVAGMVGFANGGLRGDLAGVSRVSLPDWLPGLASSPHPPAHPPAGPQTSREQQSYLDLLWLIRARLEQSVVRMGLLAAFYKSRDIDRSELKAHLDEGLASYRLTEEQLRALQPPPALRGPHEGYVAAVRLFQQSALEMLKMYDDGDEDHFSAALPFSLEGTTRMRELSDQFWPDN